MVEVITSEQKSLLLAGYVLGDLSAEEGRAVVGMLDAEPTLRSELADLQASFNVVYGASAVPPAGLKDSVLAGFDRSFERTERSVERPLLTGLNRQWTWRGLGAVAAGLIVALTVQNQNLRQTVEVLQAQDVSRSAETIDVSLSATEVGADAGRVSLAIDPTNLNAVLVAEGLEPLAGNEVYVLWTVVEPGVPVTTDEKGAILTAVFAVDDGGGQTQAVDLPGVFGSVDDVRAIAVTVEDADSPQAHRSSPILIQEL